jgi:hypothetical protein
MQSNKIYQEKLKAIRPFTKLGIKNRVNFTPSQKRLITIYHNELTDNGLIEQQDGRYIQKVKFIKGKKSNRKGNPRINGVFIQGAMPNDKLDKQGRIIKGAYIKEFIPVEFKGFHRSKDQKKYVENKLRKVLKGRDLKEIDYFTIVLLGGWELGQNMQAKTPIKERRHGREYTKEKRFDLKIRELTSVIYNLLTTSVNRYEVKDSLIIGLYYYKFKNQRKPNKKELKAMK